MERKIGEIFQYNGEWYQCVEGNCTYCSMNDEACEQRIMDDVCKVNRIFKKLEKVGEPYMTGNKLIQRYKIYPTTCCINVYGWYYQNLDIKSWTIDIEIKQTKEDMEEKKIQHYDCFFDRKQSNLNLKPFNLEAAKAGKPVCTRDGRKTRVLCYDFKQNEEYPILVAVENKDGKECALLYSNDGISEMYKSSNNELAILLEKKEGWVNVYKECDGEYYVEKVVYKIKGHAVENASSQNYVGTVRIEFYE